MEQYDVVIVGAATAGSYLARKIAEKGCSVLVLEQHPKEKLGRRLDIFHVAKADFARYGLPLPEKDDDFAFEFSGGRTFSAFDRYPKKNTGTVVGMHMHRYIARLNNWAREAGAEFRYGAAFVDFLYDGNAAHRRRGLRAKRRAARGVCPPGRGLLRHPVRRAAETAARLRRGEF